MDHDHAHGITAERQKHAQHAVPLRTPQRHEQAIPVGQMHGTHTGKNKLMSEF